MSGPQTDPGWAAQLLQRMLRFWAFRSLAVGTISTTVDYSVLLVSVQGLGLSPVPSSTAAVLAGGVVGFILNKYFAFHDQSRRIGAQLVKYGLVFAAELLLHNRLIQFLLERLELHYLLSKLLADVLVFSCLHLLLMRHFIFGPPTLVEKPRPQPQPPPAPLP